MWRQEEGLVGAREVRLAEVFPVALTEGASFSVNRSVNRLAEQALSLLLRGCLRAEYATPYVLFVTIFYSFYILHTESRSDVEACYRAFKYYHR
jgi:hypothetical protein